MYQCAVSSKAKMTSLTGLVKMEPRLLPILDLPLITQLGQVNSKLIIQQ